MIGLFWTPGFWITGCALAAAIVIAFWTERFETRAPRQTHRRPA